MAPSAACGPSPTTASALGAGVSPGIALGAPPVPNTSATGQPDELPGASTGFGKGVSDSPHQRA
ncbi:hypothetical protein [Saccharopolyspora sp. 5N708]|uniref:hypothetical protein n=1 Tax=Saccharopolyspora sp. 5N708 TaxID=3457424 RepID=UPI003FCF9D38